MASTLIQCDDSAYVLASSSDGLLQNTSPSDLRVIFAASLPSVSADNFHILSKGQSIGKAGGTPSGNIYIRSQDGRTNNVVFSN